MRSVATVTLLCVLTATAAGADPAPPKKPGDPWHELTLSPRAIERPLSKYRLMPAEFELHEGNAAPILLRLPWEQTPYFANELPKLSEYLDLPLNSPKFQGDDVFPFFKRIKSAAYRKTAEWQYPIGEQPIGEILLPDIQGARYVVGHGLSAWIRQRLAQGKVDEAREGIRVGLAVVRHYGRTPFAITQLVCCAVDSMFLSRIAELISQPESPNLYWALTQLPRPLIDVRHAVEMDERFLQMTVPGLDDLKQIRTKEEWTGRALAVIQFFRESDQQAGRSGNGAAFERVVKAARADLPASTEGGAKLVDQMSDGEAALRWLLDVNNDLAGERTALNSMQPPQAFPRLAAMHERIKDFRTVLGLKWSFLTTSILNTYISSHKIEREIDALRIVEALRHYAANHEGHLPESLDKISELPIPNDPLTGRPFHYEVKDGVATLSGEAVPLPDPEREPAAIRYTLRIRK
ncbi:MAG TPA: hypothetical protein VFG04_13180 [Planctomycetaceae bacterium]|jgi:hypothetical protein|nr:hypothetical protein [Planctomycetaceae bacterium]